jgi:hypothetical protein
MGTVTCPEIRVEFGLTTRQRAKARDAFVRDFERRFNDWSEIAKVCCEIERDRDWEILGFRSWNQWLIDAAPRSRSYIYLVTGRYKELCPDFTDEELAQIDLDSTNTLRKLSPAVRRDPVIRAAAKKKPRELRQAVIEHHPEQHIEEQSPRVLNFSDSAADVYDDALKTWRALNNHESTAEEFIEYLCSGFLDAQWEDSGYNNRQRAQQIEEMTT